MAERFDDLLLDEFAHSFYGYGHYGGQFWFIGMEEGGGDSFTEVAKRLEAWALRGRREIDDVAEYLAASCMPSIQDCLTWVVVKLTDRSVIAI